eukprot:1158864-Pelagomonas_calceolata.AAC.2
MALVALPLGTHFSVTWFTPQCLMVHTSGPLGSHLSASWFTPEGHLVHTSVPHSSHLSASWYTHQGHLVHTSVPLGTHLSQLVALLMFVTTSMRESASLACSCLVTSRLLIYQHKQQRWITSTLSLSLCQCTMS